MDVAILVFVVIFCVLLIAGIVVVAYYAVSSAQTAVVAAATPPTPAGPTCPSGGTNYGGTCYSACPAGTSPALTNPGLCVPATCADGVKTPGPSGACYRAMQPLSGGSCPAGWAQPTGPGGTVMSICYSQAQIPFDPTQPAVYNAGVPRPTVPIG